MINLKELSRREAYSFRDQRRHGVSDKAVCLGARIGKAEPIWEALDSRGLAGSQGAVLCRVDEHQAVFAQMGDDGAAWVPATLSSVSVFER